VIRIYGLDMFKVSSGFLVPFACVSLIDTVDGTPVRGPYVGVGKEEFAQAGIQGEAMDPITGGIDKHGAGSIHKIACSQLVAAFLKAIFLGAPFTLGLPLQDGKD